MERSASRARPLGITIIAVLLLILGIIAVIIGGIAIAGFSSVGHIFGHNVGRTAVDVLGDILGGIPLVFGILALIFSWGMFTLKRWAFWLTVILDILLIISRIKDFLDPSHHIGGLVVAAIGIVILIYLFVDRNVRNAFQR